MSEDDAVGGAPVADGWNPGSRRAHRDQAARAGVLIALALGVLWWFDASAPVQTLVVAAFFGIEAWIAWMRRDSVALRAFSVAASVGLVGALAAVAWAGNALLLAGLALLCAAVMMRDLYLGGLGVGIAISGLRVVPVTGDDDGLMVMLVLMLAGVLALLHVGVRRMGDEI